MNARRIWIAIIGFLGGVTLIAGISSVISGGAAAFMEGMVFATCILFVLGLCVKDD